ncbi:MAG: HD domain-containing protein [Ruminiclostridium sp.]
MHEKLLMAAIEYDKGDPKRIQHFIKVHSFARLIGKQEKLSDEMMKALETAAILHDIGIHEGERLYGRNDGEIQQKLGPDIAKGILQSVGGYEDVTERVMYLIAHHHTYTGIDGKDLQILIEADFIVNLYEDNASEKAVRNAYERIFVTESGKKILRESFGI